MDLSAADKSRAGRRLIIYMGLKNDMRSGCNSRARAKCATSTLLGNAWTLV